MLAEDLLGIMEAVTVKETVRGNGLTGRVIGLVNNP
jgi:hypothetical protein